MNGLGVVTWHGYRGTFYWTSWRAWVANMIVRPVTFLMVFGILHDQLELGATQAIIVPLVAYCGVAGVLMCAHHSIRNDQMEGTFTLAMTTPASPAAMWLTRSLGHVPNGLASILSALLFAALAFDVDLAEVDLAVVVAFAAVLCSGLALALLSGLLTRHLGDWVGPVALASGLLLTLSGAVIPRHVLPEPLGLLSAVVPLSHANEALRRAFALSPGSPWPDIAAELAVAAGIGVVALALFHRAMAKARRVGSLIVEGT